MSKTIKSNNPITIQTPAVNFDVTSLKVVNPLAANNANTKIISQNSVTGLFETVDSSVVSFKTDLQNVGGFNTLIQTPGNASTHNIKTIRSTTGSIGITSAATNLDLNANVTLNNLPSGGSTVLSNPGSGSAFDFKTLLASTGINIGDNVSNVFVGLNAMTPNEIGGVYGSQRSREDNHIGFKTGVPDGSKSNIIGAELPSTLLGDTSNIMSSYINLTSANGTFSRSNIILSGDNSEINSVSNTHLIGNDFSGTGLDMESSLYIGNMRNTKPTTVSTCINQNTYGNTIEMAKNSWYIGSGRNPITLATNEMHFDTGCDRLYYHDLAAGSNSNILFYDASTGLITQDNVSALPPLPGTNIYNSDGSLTSNRTLTLGGFNLVVSGVGNINISSTLGVTLDSSAALNLGSTNATSITIGRSGINNNLRGTLFAPNLTLDNTKTSYLGYDSVSKQIVYGTSTTLPNIYTSNGTLNSTRTLTLGGFNLTTTGSGNLVTNNTGTVSITPTSSTTVGTINQTHNANGRLFFNNISAFDFGTLRGFVTMNISTREVAYITGGNVIDEIFSVGFGSTNTFGSGTFDVPLSFTGPGFSFGPNSPGNHPGYNNTVNLGDAFSLVTGVYTPVVNRTVEVIMKVVCRNTLEIPSFELQLFDSTINVVRCYAKHEYGAINVYNTYMLTDRIFMSAGNNYYFRMIFGGTGLGLFQIETAIFSINIV